MKLRSQVIYGDNVISQQAKISEKKNYLQLYGSTEQMIQEVVNYFETKRSWPAFFTKTYLHTLDKTEQIQLLTQLMVWYFAFDIPIPYQNKVYCKLLKWCREEHISVYLEDVCEQIASTELNQSILKWQRFSRDFIDPSDIESVEIYHSYIDSVIEEHRNNRDVDPISYKKLLKSLYLDVPLKEDDLVWMTDHFDNSDQDFLYDHKYTHSYWAIPYLLYQVEKLKLHPIILTIAKYELNKLEQYETVIEILFDLLRNHSSKIFNDINIKVIQLRRNIQNIMILSQGQVLREELMYSFLNDEPVVRCFQALSSCLTDLFQNYSKNLLQVLEISRLVMTSLIGMYDQYLKDEHMFCSFDPYRNAYFIALEEISRAPETVRFCMQIFETYTRAYNNKLKNTLRELLDSSLRTLEEISFIVKPDIECALKPLFDERWLAKLVTEYI